MKIVILDSATLGDDIDLSPIAALGQVTEYKTTADKELPEKIAEAEVIILNKLRLGKHNLPYAKSLRLICVTATGYDNIDTEYCRTHGIALCNVPAYSTDSVAQLTLTMALALVSKADAYRRYIREGEYTRSGKANCLVPVYHEMSSLTWGVVGGGNIGSRVAALAEAFGCRILMCRQKQDSRYEICGIDELCRKADIISLHVPLTEKTRGMLSRERLQSMKKGAILINMARGAVADEAAIAELVGNGHLGGIGIDVFTSEPFGADHPYNKISDMDNVFLTPHMSWGSYESRQRCMRVISENIAEFYKGGNKNRIV